MFVFICQANNVILFAQLNVQETETILVQSKYNQLLLTSQVCVAQFHKFQEVNEYCVLQKHSSHFVHHCQVLFHSNENILFHRVEYVQYIY